MSLLVGTIREMQQERGMTEFFPAHVFRILLACLGYDSWKYLMCQGDEGKGDIKCPEGKK